ncbi:Cys/Met metabolism PLP-dependent enzyme-domain-containing protein [Lipomyces oligophaga]|uniref:Cys/Met metabolism PLP-dependent enzyme-domain-containing protein n=1 Tax=Lipomyces oligophaga TaxID=45792 RepID=UPI0034CE3E7B
MAPLDTETKEHRKQYKLETEIVYTAPTDQYRSSSTPIYQTATFKQASGTEMGEYDYTRSGNPSRTDLENHLARIMRATRVLAVTSGMSAMDVISRLLKPGDEVIAGDDLYGGTNRLLTFLSANWGITVYHVDTTIAANVIDKLSENTALVLLESPTNPLIKICDIPYITKVVKEKYPNALVAVDNTMMSPIGMNPLDVGVDIVYESATKFLGGHHSLMAGVLAVKSAELGDKLYFVINSTGCGLAPFDCWLLHQGLKTLAIRFERAQENAQKVAEFLEDRGFKVRYPGLKSHPQYNLHWTMARAAGSVLSFETGSVEMSEQVVSGARLWGISVSFGCVNSLISMPCKMSHASIDPKVRAERALPEDLIRLCVGIEDVTDLIDDLKTALVSANALKE